MKIYVYKLLGQFLPFWVLQPRIPPPGNSDEISRAFKVHPWVLLFPPLHCLHSSFLLLFHKVHLRINLKILFWDIHLFFSLFYFLSSKSGHDNGHPALLLPSAFPAPPPQTTNIKLLTCSWPTELLHFSWHLFLSHFQINCISRRYSLHCDWKSCKF